jgi:hypothetical protein
MSAICAAVSVTRADRIWWVELHNAAVRQYGCNCHRFIGRGKNDKGRLKLICNDVERGEAFMAEVDCVRNCKLAS